MSNTIIGAARPAGPIRPINVPTASPQHGMSTERAEILLLLESELLRHAFSALVARDRRFEIRDPRIDLQNNTRGTNRAVALTHDWINGPDQVRQLSGQSVAGVVLLSESDHRRYDSLTGLGLSVTRLPWDTPWSYVAASLLELFRSANPGCDLPRVEAGSCVSAAELALRSLTRRELQVLSLVAEGLSAKHMASALNLAESTIDNHKSALLKKFGVKKSVELARIAYRLGVVSP